MKYIGIFSFGLFFLSACSGDSKETAPDTDTEDTNSDKISILETVGSEGGTLETTNGTETVTLEIPVGALDFDVEIGIEEIDVEDLSVAMEDLIDLAGGAYVFTPHGTSFTEPVAITLPQTGIADTILRLDDESDMTWEMVPNASFTANTASFQTSTFSVYLPVSVCETYCQNVEDVCPDLDPEICLSTCETLNISNPPSTCTTEVADNLVCLTAVTAFDCSTGAPDPLACEAEEAAALDCVDGAPSIPDVLITWIGIGEKPNELDDLTCSASGSIDPEGQAVTYSYSWESASGHAVPGETLLSSETLVSDFWTCTAKASDGSRISEASELVEIITSNSWSNCDTTQTLNDAQQQIVGGNVGDFAGSSVSSAGDVDGDGLNDILIGAYASDDGGEDSGKAYLILGSSLGNNAIIDLSTADYSFTGENIGDLAGGSVSGAGDVDGDGLDDILIGASYNGDGGVGAGKTYLILGSSLGNDANIDLSTADYSFTGENEGHLVGYSVSTAGDVDGDDLDDILIGAYGSEEAGKSYLILGSSLGNDANIDLSTADYSFIGEDSWDRSGISVSSAGDVDGDGLDDILIGASYNTDGGTEAGKSYLILGSSLGSDPNIDLSTADYSFIGESDLDGSGISVSSAGDVDGDDLDDILIGAYLNDDGGSEAGKSYLILGSSLGSSSIIDLSIADYSFIGEGKYDLAGYSVSSAGDVDGDGLSDILIGAHGNEDAGIQAGKSYLILGSSLGNDAIIDLSIADYSFTGENPGEFAGQSVSSAGDVDGDGLSDILIGAYYAEKVGLFKACPVQ
jgi:hypothetical protein